MVELYSNTWSEVAQDNDAAAPDGWSGGISFPNIPPTGREMMAAIKREWNLSHPTLTTGGDGDAVTLTPGAAITEYKHGQVFAAKLNVTLGAAGAARPTLNVSGKGAKKIYLATYAGGHTQLRISGGEAKAGQVVFFRYDSTLDSGSGGFVIFSYLPVGRKLEAIEFALTSENGAPAGAFDAFVFRLPYAFELADIKASLKVAQTSGSLIAIYVGAGRFPGTPLVNSMSIDNGELSSVTAASPPNITAAAASLASGTEISVSVVQVGDGTARGLKVTFLGYQI